MTKLERDKLLKHYRKKRDEAGERVKKADKAIKEHREKMNLLKKRMEIEREKGKQNKLDKRFNIARPEAIEA